VVPTGSWKSRLLADIECLAQCDTPTGRKVLVNYSIPDANRRFSAEHKLVAQLSQNMNFLVDLTVGELVTLHAKSRMNSDLTNTVNRIIECANTLAGEPICYDMPITQLSGGQSRARMISATALLSPPTGSRYR
jgi:ABC-type lipoprotein export system ATPase subunit